MEPKLGKVPQGFYENICLDLNNICINITSQEVYIYINYLINIIDSYLKIPNNDLPNAYFPTPFGASNLVIFQSLNF